MGLCKGYIAKALQGFYRVELGLGFSRGEIGVVTGLYMASRVLKGGMFCRDSMVLVTLYRV